MEETFVICQVDVSQFWAPKFLITVAVYDLYVSLINDGPVMKCLAGFLHFFLNRRVPSRFMEVDVGFSRASTKIIF